MHISWLNYDFCLCNRHAFAVKRISSPCFEITESTVKNSLRSVSYIWNRGIRHIKLLGKGEDWSKFFKVTVFLYFTKWVLSYSLAVFVGIAMVFAFTAFFVYEQYEPVIDGLGEVLDGGVGVDQTRVIGTLNPFFKQKKAAKAFESLPCPG
ncbi:hypothetical protein Gotur_034521, partial [Gossypium turneri]